MIELLRLDCCALLESKCWYHSGMMKLLPEVLGNSKRKVTNIKDYILFCVGHVRPAQIHLQDRQANAIRINIVRLHAPGSSSKNGLGLGYYESIFGIN